MKYLLTFGLFENASNDEIEEYKDWSEMNYDDKLQILIPQSSPIVPTPNRAIAAINKICNAVKTYTSRVPDKKWLRPTLNSDEGEIKLPIRVDSIFGLRDKLRWADYLDNITNSATEIRGFYFEGFVAGLYGGDRTEKGKRADVMIGSNGVSIKTTTGSPTLCSGKEMTKAFIIDRESEISKTYPSYRTLDDLLTGQNKSLTDIFKDPVYKPLRSDVWDSLFVGVSHFMIFHFNDKTSTRKNDNNVKVKTKIPATEIYLNLFTSNELRNLVVEGKVEIGAPRKDDKFELRISSGFKKYGKKYTIRIPEISETELDKLWNKNIRVWGGLVFGDLITRRMRTDVIEDIEKNKEIISQNLNKVDTPNEEPKD